MPDREVGLLLGQQAPSFAGWPWVPCERAALSAHGAKWAFVGVPFDQAQIYRTGTSAAPRTMRHISDQFLTYLGDFDLDLVEEARVVDAGDIPMIPADAKRCRTNIETYVGEILDAGAVPLCVGGDHSIPIPIGRAFASRHEGKVGYLHFDSHLDCQPDVDGELFTNWSHMARMVELDNVDPANVAVVGIRGGINPAVQWRFAREHGIRVYRMGEIDERGIGAVVTEALDRVTDGTDAFYVSYDSDVVDCSAMPGTTGPEPGGLTARQMLRACELVGDRHPAVVDLVELTPAYDHPSFISHRLGAYMLFHTIGGAHRGPDWGTRRRGADALP